MVVLNRIYTRTGDKGATALGDGTRVPKQSLRVEAYGTVDETNATVGLARLHAADVAGGEMDAALARIQNDLFDLGADLCRPNPDKDGEAKYPVLRVTQAQVDRLERGREEKSKFSVQRLQGLLYAREKELRHLQRKCRGLEGKLEEFGGDADIFELSPSSTRSGDSPAPSSASGSVSKGARGSPSTPAGSARGGSPLRPVDLNSAP